MNENLKNQAIALRAAGKSYNEIRRLLPSLVPKSTLSAWLRGMPLSESAQADLQKRVAERLVTARQSARQVLDKKRTQRVEQLRNRLKDYSKLFENKSTSLLALSLLYLAEGGKRQDGSLMFGNSDPAVIRLFLYLLRRSYDIDERKFRCTVQCRADQDTAKLQAYWSEITNIPSSQFYKARIDPRTIGRPTQQVDYKGVCRVDYFSSAVFQELMIIPQLIDEELFSGPVV